MYIYIYTDTPNNNLGTILRLKIISLYQTSSKQNSSDQIEIKNYISSVEDKNSAAKKIGGQGERN